MAKISNIDGTNYVAPQPEPENPTIQLTFDLNTVNFILAALGDLSIKTGAGNLIGEIHKQAEPQIIKVDEEVIPPPAR